MTRLTVLTLTVAAAFGIQVPFAGYTVFGAAELEGRINDIVRVGIAAEQVDGGLSDLSLVVPHGDALEYHGVEVGAYGGELVAEPVEGGTAVTWTGELPVGADGYVGHVLLRVVRADRSEFRATALDATGSDLDGLSIEELEITQSAATVTLLPRPTLFRLDLVVEPSG